jgi:phytoene synthase
MPAGIRPAFATLWNLDLALADVVATSSDPALGAIRLAWWRERLEELDTGKPPPGEPRLSAIARQLLLRGVTGAELSKLEDAWLPLLEPFPWDEPQSEGLKLRGRVLFGIGARLLGGEIKDAEMAGEIWSLADGADHCSDQPSRIFLHRQAVSAASQLPRKVPRALRPLTVLAALAAYDVRPGGRLGRGAAAIAHRLTGQFPR